MANSGGREKKSSYSYSRISSRFPHLILSRLGRGSGVGGGDDGIRGSVRHLSSFSGPSWLRSEGDTASWRCQGRTPVPCPSVPSVRVEPFSLSIRRDSEKNMAAPKMHFMRKADPHINAEIYVVDNGHRVWNSNPRSAPS